MRSHPNLERTPLGEFSSYTLDPCTWCINGLDTIWVPMADGKTKRAYTTDQPCPRCDGTGVDPEKRALRDERNNDQ